MKAVVMEIRNNDVVLLRDDGSFTRARNRDYMIGDVIDMKTSTTRIRFVTAAAAAAVVVLLALGVFAYTTPYYYVSMDVNPGVMMTINRFNRVIAMEPANEDAAAIVAGIEWKNQNVDEVVQNAALEIEENGYFEQGGEILLASAGKNADKAAKLAERLDVSVEELELEDVEVNSEAIGYEMVQSAKALSMTPGKYNLITKHLGVTVDESNVEEYRNMSVRDIMKNFTDTKGLQGNENSAEAKDKSDKANGNSEAAKERVADKKEARETEQVRVENPAQETAETNREMEQIRNSEPAQETAVQNRETEQVRVEDPSRETAETIRQTEQVRNTDPGQETGATEQNSGNTTQAASQNGQKIDPPEVQGNTSGAGPR
ncbi:MAG: hypothetical protein GX028_02355 [Clostridiaceae bacterium]|nr:hypothetical protein [Clostridiaceae bacterium]